MNTHSPRPPAPDQDDAAVAVPDAGLADSVWEIMSAFVLGNDPTDHLREALGLGRGTGRVKALIGLADAPLSLTELARRIGVDPPYATIIVNELQALGLLSRSADGLDRRRKLVELTPQGRAAARKAKDIIARPPSALRDMPTDDLAKLHQLLGHLRPPGASTRSD